MKVLVIGPSDTRAHGGMSEVIRAIRTSELLNREFEIDIFPSYIDGNLIVRLWYSVYRYVRFLFVYQKYDLFHIHTAEKGSTFRKNLYLNRVKRAGKKAIIHIHGAEYLTFYDGLRGKKKQITDEFFRRADMVLALSDRWKKELEARLPMACCRVLHNGIDCAAFRQAGSDPAENRNSFLLLGRLGARKGVYDLIQAVELAVRKNPNLTVCLAGDGEVEKVRALVEEKGLRDRIHVSGWIGEEEKKACLKKAATIVLPSYHEGLPVFILEGMAAGKAVISTTAGAIPEVVGEKNGILVAPGDVPSLANALLTCSCDVERLRSMSQTNMEQTEQRFHIRQVHEQLAEYYRQVMGYDRNGNPVDQRNRTGL